MELRIERPQSGYLGQTTGALAGSILGLVILVGGLIFIIKTGAKNNSKPANNLAEEIVWEDNLNLDKFNANNIKQTPLSDKLQIEIIRSGHGDRESKSGDKLEVNYTGWLTDGTKFDSSYDRGTPFVFTLGAGEVIKGWDQGLRGMVVGEKRKLIIPANLAYGKQGNGEIIPSNAILIFEVELLKIE